MKKTLLWLIALFYSSWSLGQVGINTTTPQAMLDIHSQGNTAATKAIRITNSAGKEILTVLDNGNIGLGVTNPVTSVDLRDTSNDGIVAVGNSTQTASAAGAGSLIYDTFTKYLNLSDGTNWNELAANYPRSNVLADLTGSTQTFASTANATTEIIKNWNVSFDPTNAFNGTTGVFTAQHAGIYTVSFSITFVAGTLQANSYIKAQWKASTGVTSSSIVLYYDNLSRYLGITCSGSFKLAAGDTLAPYIGHNLGSTKSIYAGRNNLSIIES